MRDDHSVEYPLVGYPAISAWFVMMRFRRYAPTPMILRKWRLRFGMPMVATPREKGGKRKPWTTNLMLQAWLGTQGRALTLPRWHPFREANEHRTPSMKKGAIRMRRHLARRRQANIIAQANGIDRDPRDIRRERRRASESSAPGSAPRTGGTAPAGVPAKVRK